MSLQKMMQAWIFRTWSEKNIIYWRWNRPRNRNRTRRLCFAICFKKKYFLIPLISNTKKIQSVKFVLVFSFDDISVEEVCFNENSLKFFTHDGLYVNLVWRVWNFCKKFIFGEFKHSDHFFIIPSAMIKCLCAIFVRRNLTAVFIEWILIWNIAKIAINTFKNELIPKTKIK